MTVETNWKKYHLENRTLPQGAVVRFHKWSRLSGKTGTVASFGRLNYKVVIDGQPWTVAPSSIDEFYIPDNPTIPVVKVRQNGEKYLNQDDLVVGDYIVLFRGGGCYEIGQFQGLKGSNLLVKALSGRKAGKVFRYQPDMYFCKLPKDRFDN